MFLSWEFCSTAIDIDLIELNYSKQTKIKRLFGIGTDTQEVLSQIVKTIKIDFNIIENIEIEFGNFSSKIGINGFIGNDILREKTLSRLQTQSKILYQIQLTLCHRYVYRYQRIYFPDNPLCTHLIYRKVNFYRFEFD